MADKIKYDAVRAEAMAYACVCACAATNRLLLQKGIITEDEFAEAIDMLAETAKTAIYTDKDEAMFLSAVGLIKNLAAV